MSEKKKQPSTGGQMICSECGEEHIGFGYIIIGMKVATQHIGTLAHAEAVQMLDEFKKQFDRAYSCLYLRTTGGGE